MPVLQNTLKLAALLLVLAPAAPDHAQASTSPFAGHWEADVKGDGRIFTFVFDFNVRADSLGGTVSIAQRDIEIPVRGLVRGNHIHFEQFGLWNGSIEKGELRLTRGLDGGKIQHLAAHRVAQR
jgi:hypothetical protein